MSSMICPSCDAPVFTDDIEHGECPECGAILEGFSFFEPDDEEHRFFGLMEGDALPSKDDWDDDFDDTDEELELEIEEEEEEDKDDEWD